MDRYNRKTSWICGLRHKRVGRTRINCTVKGLSQSNFKCSMFPKYDKHNKWSSVRLYQWKGCLSGEHLSRKLIFDIFSLQHYNFLASRMTLVDQCSIQTPMALYTTLESSVMASVVQIHFQVSIPESPLIWHGFWIRLEIIIVTCRVKRLSDKIFIGIVKVFCLSVGAYN